ncbi:hypothetical protein P692DRAFT_20882093 [Suillus brevipes Sb2]|nr:hypothetical protein P692DRAFT_20882093 [Suillus brevipes Sb2]
MKNAATLQAIIGYICDTIRMQRGPGIEFGAVRSLLEEMSLRTELVSCTPKIVFERVAVVTADAAASPKLKAIVGPTEHTEKAPTPKEKRKLKNVLRTMSRMMATLTGDVPTATSKCTALVVWWPSSLIPHPLRLLSLRTHTLALNISINYLLVQMTQTTPTASSSHDPDSSDATQNMPDTGMHIGPSPWPYPQNISYPGYAPAVGAGVPNHASQVGPDGHLPPPVADV